VRLIAGARALPLRSAGVPGSAPPAERARAAQSHPARDNVAVGRLMSGEQIYSDIASLSVSGFRPQVQRGFEIGAKTVTDLSIKYYNNNIIIVIIIVFLFKFLIEIS